MPLAGYVVARWLLARVELRLGLVGLAALFLPTLAVSLWLLPLVRETASHNPSDAELARSLRHYGDQLVVYSLHSYRVAAALFAACRGGRRRGTRLRAARVLRGAVAAGRRSCSAAPW